MKNLKLILGTGALLIFAIGAGLIVVRHPNTATTESDSSQNVRSYSMSEVSTHDTASDCWTAVNGKVYNLTSFTDNHPGGPQAIISLCGIDGTAQFQGKHEGERRPVDELGSLLIGELK